MLQLTIRWSPAYEQEFCLRLSLGVHTGPSMQQGAAIESGMRCGVCSMIQAIERLILAGSTLKIIQCRQQHCHRGAEG